MCGEHDVPAARGAKSAGSSPHVRGAPRPSPVNVFHAGIIPACAGSTGAIFEQETDGWDHPRMCGEHVTRNNASNVSGGSSPHVRGAPEVFDGVLSATWDHPRMCGEHPCFGLQNNFLKGSSPHVRGAPRGLGLGLLDGGIIPACAGSTRSRQWTRRWTGDHPRMCGEHRRNNASPSTHWGSSPHVRGALQRTTTISILPGIIPACAGSTVCEHGRLYPERDHPRMCGEHTSKIA